MLIIDLELVVPTKLRYCFDQLFVTSLLVSSLLITKYLYQAHPWFNDIVWDKLYEMDAAFKPEVNGELDTQNFMKFDEVFMQTSYFSFLFFSFIISSIMIILLFFPVRLLNIRLYLCFLIVLFHFS